MATTAAQVKTAYKALHRADLNDVIAQATADAINSGTTTLDAYIAQELTKVTATTQAAVAISAFVTGVTPTSDKLDALKVAADAQLASYTAMGAAIPELGAYEAFGVGFSSTPEFAAKYGAASDADFINGVYTSVFGTAPSAGAFANFTSQIAYFTDLYLAAGLDADVAAAQAKGAVLGQIVGYAFVTASSADSNLDNQVAAALTKAANGDTSVYDAPLAGGAPGTTQSFTVGIDNLVGTGGDDIFNATQTATSAVLGGLDKVDGGAGVDTLNIADTAVGAAAAFALPAGFSITNVENINVTTNGNVGAAGVDFDLSANAGVTTINAVAAGTVGSFIKASNTADVNLTVAGAATAAVNGGKAVAVTGGTGTTDVSGKGLTSVVVKGGGVATVDNLENTVAATTAKGTTLKAVTLDAIAGATAGVKGAALESVTLQNQKTALAVTVTNDTSTKLDVNVNGAGYDATGAAVAVSVAAGSKAATINLNATGAKSSVTVSGVVAKTLNITGDAALTLAGPLTTATKIDGSAATGNLTLGDLAAGTVTVSTGAGKDSFAIQATAKVTVDAGAGDDAVTLKSAVAAGSTINLGAGNDKLLVSGAGSVLASTVTAITVIDGGDGIDSVSASLINAANAGQFKNFEQIDLSATTPTALDVELVTGSTITGLTLSGGAGGATVNNVAAGVGLTVSGSNAGVTTIGVKGAAAGAADSFTTTFAGTAASTATELAPTAVAAGTVVTNGVEALNVVSGGTGFVSNSLTVTDSALQSVTITGDKALTLAFTGVNGTIPTSPADAVNGVSLIDGSAATGALTINTTGVTNVANAGLTVNTGSGKDVITLAQKATVDAGAGADQIITSVAGGTLTGGAGNDKFDVTASVAVAALTEATGAFKTVITDFEAGDAIKLLAANTAFTSAKIALGVGVTNLDQALAQVTTTPGDDSITWFQYGANTYVVANDGAAGFTAGDIVVKLTGVLDLSNSTFDATTDYLTFA